MGRNTERGFTLIELLIVISIIAVLSAIVTPNFLRAVEKAQAEKAVHDLKAIANAATQHYADTGRWPPPINVPPYGAGFLTNDDGAGNLVPNWDGPYLETWPFHPWSKEVKDATTYQWDHKNVNTDTPELEWTIEIGLAELSVERRNYLAGLIDKTLDASDGPCAGTFRAYCPPGPAEWASWPKYVVAAD